MLWVLARVCWRAARENEGVGWCFSVFLSKGTQ